MAALIDPFIEAWDLRELVRKAELRPREVAEFFLARIERHNPTLGAYMTVLADRALADARSLEDQPDASSLPLFGSPSALKDLTPASGIRTTVGSPHSANSLPLGDSEIATRLVRSGGVVRGKPSTQKLGARPT